MHPQKVFSNSEKWNCKTDWTGHIVSSVTKWQKKELFYNNFQAIYLDKDSDEWSSTDSSFSSEISVNTNKQSSASQYTHDRRSLIELYMYECMNQRILRSYKITTDNPLKYTSRGFNLTSSMFKTLFKSGHIEAPAWSLSAQSLYSTRCVANGYIRQAQPWYLNTESRANINLLFIHNIIN